MEVVSEVFAKIEEIFAIVMDFIRNIVAMIKPEDGEEEA